MIVKSTALAIVAVGAALGTLAIPATADARVLNAVAGPGAADSHLLQVQHKKSKGAVRKSKRLKPLVRGYRYSPYGSSRSWAGKRGYHHSQPAIRRFKTNNP